jgi:hypothetical protein
MLSCMPAAHLMLSIQSSVVCSTLNGYYANIVAACIQGLKLLSNPARRFRCHPLVFQPWDLDRSRDGGLPWRHGWLQMWQSEATGRPDLPFLKLACIQGLKLLSNPARRFRCHPLVFQPWDLDRSRDVGLPWKHGWLQMWQSEAAGRPDLPFLKVASKIAPDSIRKSSWHALLRIAFMRNKRPQACHSSIWLRSSVCLSASLLQCILVPCKSTKQTTMSTFCKCSPMNRNKSIHLSWIRGCSWI